MKGARFFWIGLLVLVLIAQAVLIGFLFQARAEVRYVDSAKLVNGYKGMEAARKVYQLKANAWKANIDTLSSEIQNQIMNYEKSSKNLSAREKQLTEELIRTKQKQLYDYQQAI